jgi:DNA-binding HxlR family transcriptional regulator
VEYALTDLGQSLLEPIYALARWADEYADAVVAAQDRAEATARSALSSSN